MRPHLLAGLDIFEIIEIETYDCNNVGSVYFGTYSIWLIV